MKVAKTVLTAGLLVATAGVAQAAVQMTYNGQTSYEDVTVTSPVTTVNNTNSIRTRAGALKMGNATKSFGLDSEFVAFCLDLSAFINTANYDKTGTPFLGGVDLSSNPGGLARRQYMQNLFDNVYGTFDKNNSVQSAALQVALWEIAYETGTVGSVSTSDGGGFRITSTGGQSANVIAQANTYLSFIGNNVVDKFRLTFLENVPDPDSQNLVTVSPVPLPAAGLLLFGALGALGLTSRRRKAAAEA